MPVREFHLTYPSLPSKRPCPEKPLTNPVTLVVACYPLGQYVTNPNFALVHPRSNAHDPYQAPLWTMLTASSSEPLSPSPEAGKTRFWMKTWSENEGILEQLVDQGILKKTNVSVRQGYVQLVAVDLCLKEDECVNVCHACYEVEQLDSKKKLNRCSKCKDCSKECQKDAWGWHKQRCKAQ